MPAPSLAASVAVLLVSHDGSRWLPGVLAGVAEQTTTPSTVVAVDTGSRDDSAGMVEAASLVDAVLRVDERTGYPEAVRLGLERIDLHEGEHEWVWLLHDDSRPAPDALAALLEAAAAQPDVGVLGPKLREWPSLKRLLEVGVTISGTGRRETGLERGEYDQGQHDEQHDVLAVNTAGMLVRRSVLEQLGGFDQQLPLFGNDLDFGWRAAAAGHRTVVVPQAVVFHVEAAHRGARRTLLTGSHTHRQERRAALYTLLVNRSGRSLPLLVLRLVLGTMLRAVGYLLVRSPGEAVDDVAALVGVLGRPGRLRAARRDRGRPGPPQARVRALLAPVWLPYRHGLDFVGDVAAATTDQAADVAERRRVAAAELDPSSLAARRVAVDDDDLVDNGALARFLTNPVALVLTAVVLVCLVGARAAFGHVTGGALAPVPTSDGEWWRLHTESWHAIGGGTAVPAPPIVLPLAVLGVVLGPVGAVSLLLVGAVPFGLWGAWRFLRVIGRLASPRGTPRWLLVVGSTTYAVAPVASGAWGSGRLGLVVAAALLPWLAHAALGFVDPGAERRQRAGWRTGLLLTLICCCAPVAWPVALVLVVLVLAGGLLIGRRVLAARDVWLPPVVTLVVPLVLLAPWWLAALAHGAAESLVLDVGRVPMPAIEPLDVLAGRVSAAGAPAWAGGLLLVLALLSLVPRNTRIVVALCWSVALVAVGSTVLLGLLDLSLAGGETSAGLGLPILLAQGAWVSAVVIGGQSLARASAMPWRVAAAGLLVVAAVVPAVGLVWFVAGDDDLGSTSEAVVPAYMQQTAVTGPEHGVLVVRGDVDTGLTYVIERGDGITLGEDEVLALSTPDRDESTALDALLSRPTEAVLDRVRALGIEFLLLPAPADGAVSAALDATPGLLPGSSDPGARAWRVQRPPPAGVVDGPGSPWRVALLVLQGVGLVSTLVLAAPSVRAARSRAAS